MMKVNKTAILSCVLGSLFVTVLVGCSHDEADDVKVKLEPANSKFKMSNPSGAGGGGGTTAGKAGKMLTD
jgi:hypothetical protein